MKGALPISGVLRGLQTPLKLELRLECFRENTWAWLLFLMTMLNEKLHEIFDYER